MKVIASIHPIIMQLMIVPFFVIGIGVLFAILSKRVYVGPITTMLLTLTYNYWYFTTFYPDSKLSFTMISSWCIIFPLVSLYLSWLTLMQFQAFKEFTILEHQELD